MTTATNLPSGRRVYLDQNGRPLAGGTITYYRVDTTDLAVVYTDDALTVPSPNPIQLDSAGSCISFGVGPFREYLLDLDGNVVSDSVVVGTTALVVTDAMLPVLQAATPADAETILTGGQTSVFSNITVDGDQSLHVSPTANFPDTLTSLTVQGDATTPNAREFLVNFGLNTAVGQGGQTGNDKVTAYLGLDAKSGTSDVWTLNTCLTNEAGSGSYNSQGYELDFNNFNANRGASGNLAADFTAPIANGLSITGAGSFSSTGGLVVHSLAPAGAQPQWNRSLVTLGTAGVCAYQEWSTCPVGVQFDGAYSVAAINLTSVYGNAGAITPTAMFMKNQHRLAWQSADTTNVITDFVDAANNRYVGLGSNNSTAGIFMGATTVPFTSGLGLGASSNRWGDLYTTNIRMANNSVISWDLNPANNLGQPGLAFDMVTTLNDRVVGSNAKTIFMGATTSPQTVGFDLGSAENTWGSLFATNGLTTPSDLRLKDDVVTMASTLDAVTAVTPIEFRWKNDPAAIHYGFNASDVQTWVPNAVQTYGTDELKYLRKDDLLAVLWRAVQELAQKVDSLYSPAPASADPPVTDSP